MKKVQNAVPRPTFTSRPSNLNRMDTHNKKVPDRVKNSTSQRTNKGISNEKSLKPDQRMRDNRNQNRQFLKQVSTENGQGRKEDKSQEKTNQPEGEVQHESNLKPADKEGNKYNLSQEYLHSTDYNVKEDHSQKLQGVNLHPFGSDPANVNELGQIQGKKDVNEEKPTGLKPVHDRQSSEDTQENVPEGRDLLTHTGKEIPHKDEILNIQTQDSTESGIESSLQESINIDIDNNLPETVILLTTKGGSKVYVVGTVHFSLESQRDVADVIRAVQPDYVVLELCSSRSYMLKWNEERVLQEVQNLNFRVIKQVIQSTGFVQGGLYLLMLMVSVKITKQLGVAPGGEFRTAYREAKNVPNCVLWFGDRPMQITLQRLLSSLSLWQMITLIFLVIFREEKISKQEVETYRNRDVLERLLLGFSREQSAFAKVMIQERDLFLTYRLQEAAERTAPNKVVGVVGIGHLAGIKENWDKVTLEHVQEILSIPPPKKSFKIIKFTLKFTAVGLALYGVHKIASKSSFYSNLFRLSLFLDE